MTAIEAVNLALALTALAARAMESAARVQQLVAQAQAEGRDLSDAEIREIQDRRIGAVDRWNDGA